MNPNPPSNPNFPGSNPGFPQPPSNPGFPANPYNPADATQVRPAWQQGDYSGQQPYGQPQQFAAGPQGPGFPPGGPAPKKPRPRWLIPSLIGGGVLVLVIALIAGIAIVRSIGGGGDSSSPGATVKAYFAALQAGDAKKALSYGKEAPASTELLTDEVLKKQTEIAPIKDLKIVSESGGFMGKVHVTVTIGDVAYDEELMMQKVGDDWKLKTAAVQVKPYLGSDGDAKYVTILGKPLPASGVAYVFPGALDLGSSNKNLAVQESKFATRDDKGQASITGLSAYSSATLASVSFGLSDAGKTAAREQIAARYAACAASKDGYPTGCPQSDFTGEDGTYVWTAPSVDDIDLSDDVRDGSMTFSDTRPWSFTARARDGRPLTGTDSGYISGTITVTPDAVAVSLR